MHKYLSVGFSSPCYSIALGAQILKSPCWLVISSSVKNVRSQSLQFSFPSSLLVPSALVFPFLYSVNIPSIAGILSLAQYIRTIGNFVIFFFSHLTLVIFLIILIQLVSQTMFWDRFLLDSMYRVQLCTTFDFLKFEVSYLYILTMESFNIFGFKKDINQKTLGSQ